MQDLKRLLKTTMTDINRISSRRLTAALWLYYTCALASVEADENHPHQRSRLTVSAPHLTYICPEGARVNLTCTQTGALAHSSDQLHTAWLFTPHQDQRCHDKVHPRGTHANHSHAPPAGVQYGARAPTFWVVLHNVTQADQGRYCCLAQDVQTEHKHARAVQSQHSHILLTITPRRNGSLQCTLSDPKPPEGSVAAVLATAGCIMGILSLPLILILVYKQRQSAQSSRRANELVRMDSEVQGHENPVFLGGSPPQVKTRTVSQIMTRQSSETGRHLLSEQGTPLSPPSFGGDVFFPAQELIPESTDFLQV